MSTWYKVAWIPPLFAAVDAIAPNRGHGQDGTIGDTAHQAETSGHNPDDTPGVKAERQDADSKPEVRAADVDSDLRQPGLTMEDVVQAVLVECRAGRETRLIYIIYNGRIWRAANGWREERYTGSDRHDKHAHFSGHPDGDDNAAPWTCILALGDDVEQTEQIKGNQAKVGRSVGDTFADLTNGRDWWYAKPDQASNNPPPTGSRADIVFKAAQQVLAAPAAPAAEVELDAAAEERIAQRTAAIVVEQLAALRFVPDVPAS